MNQRGRKVSGQASGLAGTRAAESEKEKSSSVASTSPVVFRSTVCTRRTRMEQKADLRVQNCGEGGCRGRGSSKSTQPGPVLKLLPTAQGRSVAAAPEQQDGWGSAPTGGTGGRTGSRLPLGRKS